MRVFYRIANRDRINLLHGVFWGWDTGKYGLLISFWDNTKSTSPIFYRLPPPEDHVTDSILFSSFFSKFLCMSLIFLITVAAIVTMSCIQISSCFFLNRMHYLNSGFIGYPLVEKFATQLVQRRLCEIKSKLTSVLPVPGSSNLIHLPR